MRPRWRNISMWSMTPLMLSEEWSYCKYSSLQNNFFSCFGLPRNSAFASSKSSEDNKFSFTRWWLASRGDKLESRNHFFGFIIHNSIYCFLDIRNRLLETKGLRKKRYAKEAHKNTAVRSQNLAILELWLPSHETYDRKFASKKSMMEDR